MPYLKNMKMVITSFCRGKAVHTKTIAKPYWVKKEQHSYIVEQKFTQYWVNYFMQLV